MDLQNKVETIPPLNRVTARGKKYVYIRGTDIALVKGFSGTAAELEGAILQGFIEYSNRGQQIVRQLREAAAATLHKRTLHRARARCRSYLLTAQAISQMLEEARDKCALTGLAFDYHEKLEGDEWWRRPLAPSIDRIENKGII